MTSFLFSTLANAATAAAVPTSTAPELDNLTFGLTVFLVGMAGTLITLWVLTQVIVALRHFLPYRKEATEN